LTADTWYHAAVTVDWDNDDLYIYLNGANDGSDTTYTDTMNSTTEPTQIGLRTADDTPFDGIID
jgi:hypothetical protein